MASGGPTRDADRPRSEPELYALYVLASHYGTGVAAALLDAAIGTGTASVWVLSDNARAIAFYAKHRFIPDGTSRSDGRWGGALKCPNELVRGVPPAGPSSTPSW